MLYKRKRYNNYKLSFNSSTYIDDPITIDRQYMVQLMKPIIDYLGQNKIYEYQDFSRLFRKYKFKNEDIFKFITSFENFINQNSNEKKIHWLRKRELKKANIGEKNIIINRLAFEYYNLFSFFYHNYFSMNYPSMIGLESFLNEFKAKIDEIIQQSNRNKLKVNILLQRQEDISEEPIITNGFQNDTTDFFLQCQEDISEKPIKIKNHSNFIVSKNVVKKIIILK